MSIKNKLSVQEKQSILLDLLKSKDDNYAVFGIEKEVVEPLIKKGILHSDTYKYTGGAKITKAGRIASS